MSTGHDALHIDKHRYPVVINASEVARVAELTTQFSGITPADQAHECPVCGQRALYRTATCWVNPELVWINWHCGNCNEQYDEPHD